MGTYVIVCWKEMSVRYISNRDMTKGFVAGASPRIARLRENISRMRYKKMYQGYVAGICPTDVLPEKVPGISYIINIK